MLTSLRRGIVALLAGAWLCVSPAAAQDTAPGGEPQPAREQAPPGGSRVGPLAGLAIGVIVGVAIVALIVASDDAVSFDP